MSWHAKALENIVHLMSGLIALQASSPNHVAWRSIPITYRVETPHSPASSPIRIRLLGAVRDGCRQAGPSAEHLQTKLRPGHRQWHLVSQPSIQLSTTNEFLISDARQCHHYPCSFSVRKAKTQPPLTRQVLSPSIIDIPPLPIPSPCSKLLYEEILMP